MLLVLLCAVCKEGLSLRAATGRKDAAAQPQQTRRIVSNQLAIRATNPPQKRRSPASPELALTGCPLRERREQGGGGADG